MADQLGKSVGDMYKGAFIPGLILTGLYLLYIFGITLIRPHWAPALPPQARIFREPDGKSGAASLGVVSVIATLAAVGFGLRYSPEAPTDERIVLALSVGIGVALVAATINRVTKLGLLSAMAEKVIFVLIPPLALIFLVLGTIFLGIATPTEGGAMGAVGAIVMALMRKRLSWVLLRQAMDSTAKLTTFVVFILIGARVFSLTFSGVNGHLWVEHLLNDLPGGQIGFLIVVNLLIFVLAFFLDFFELSFIVVPLLGPVAEKLGIDPIWFGVLLAVNMQTSFMHPPFGFALFYLRSVAPPTVKTSEIYWGAVPFVLIQLIMVGLLIAFPQLVTASLDKTQRVDTDTIRIEQDTTEASAQGEESNAFLNQMQKAPEK
jgi:TRAP-type mannitol/chloroaromatic compound transport system permease large subunit